MASSRSADVKWAEKLLQGAKLGDLRMLKICAQKLNKGKGIKATISAVCDSKGEGALHWAAREGRIEILQYLIEGLGLDPDLPPSTGQREEAAHGYKLYSDKTPLLCATACGQVEAIEYLIDKGANLHARDENGLTPMHIAVFESQVQSVFALASKRVPIDSLHFFGTPLILAASRNNENMVKILLNHKAEPDMDYRLMIYTDCITPLVVSVLHGSTKCAELLIKAGANVNKRLEMASVLEMAVGSTDLLKLLLKSGANPNVSNAYGKLPIEVAAIRGFREAVEILFPLTTPHIILNVLDWSVDGLFNHVQSENYIKKEKVKSKRKMDKLKLKITEAIEHQAYVGARYICFYALQEDPNDPMVLANKTFSKMRSDKDITEGLTEIQESKSIQACLCLADILKGIGNQGGAAMVLMGGLSIQPKHPEIMKSLLATEGVSVHPNKSSSSNHEVIIEDL